MCTATNVIYRLETNLLIACARSIVDGERAERVTALLQGEVDWPYLLRLAYRHGMMPLLYWQLNATCPDAVPAAILDQLRDHFNAVARRNLHLTGELRRAVKLFEQHEISAIPWKGPTLATSVYGNLALRQFDDLDILVRRRDALHAKDLLVSCGYRPRFNLTRAQEAAYLQCVSEHRLVSADGAVIIELHWEILPRRFSLALDLERLWERSVPASLAGASTLALAPEDLLLTLCVHGATHFWQRLRWLCDIAELIRSYQQMDWGRVMEQARASGSARMLALGLFLAGDLLGAILPEEVSRVVQADQAVGLLAVQVSRRLCREGDGQGSGFERYRFLLRARERLADKLQYGLRWPTAPTGEDLVLVSLPPSLFPLYYALRPLRLAGKYGRMLLERQPG